MADSKPLQARLRELAQTEWDRDWIKGRFRDFQNNGLPRLDLDPQALLAEKDSLLDLVQERAEAYEYFSHSCAKGSALALMETFGLGSMVVVKSLSAFPGLGMTGWICGGVTGSLIALGLFFGRDDPADYEGNRQAMDAARLLLPRFEREVGSILCPSIQEEVVFGEYMDPRRSPEHFKAFQEAKGYERCALLPGIGARIAAEIILESLEKG